MKCQPRDELWYDIVSIRFNPSRDWSCDFMTLQRDHQTHRISLGILSRRPWIYPRLEEQGGYIAYKSFIIVPDW